MFPSYLHRTAFTPSASAKIGKRIFFSPRPLSLRRSFSVIDGTQSCCLSARQTKVLVTVRSKREMECRPFSALSLKFIYFINPAISIRVFGKQIPKPMTHLSVQHFCRDVLHGWCGLHYMGGFSEINNKGTEDRTRLI